MTDSGNDSDSTVSYGDGEGYCFGIFDPWFFDISNTKAARLARKLNLQLLPPSHFASQGYNDVYSHCLAQKVQRKLIGFIGQMKFKGAKKLTCDRYKSVKLCLGHTVDEDGNVLMYDRRDQKMVNDEREFLPLWTAFAYELQNFAQQCQARRPRYQITFEVHNMEMTPDVANMISTSLISTSLTQLEFNNIGEDDEVVKIAVKIAQESILLESFRLKRVPINFDAAQCLASMAENHPRLDNIHLVDCGLGKNLNALEVIFHAIKDMRYVDISENDIGRQGASCVADVLEMNPRMQVFTAMYNNLGDDDITELADALKWNSHLYQVTLEEGGRFAMMDKRKHLTDAGKAIIREATKAIVEEANVIKGRPSGNRSIPNFVNSFYNALDKGDLDLESSVGVKLHMQFRLFNLLNAWGTEYLNCNYLNELPLELMPYLLSFLQSAREVVSRWYRERECEVPMMKNNLQIVYEALASVVVPLRFVPLSSTNKRLKSG